MFHRQDQISQTSVFTLAKCSRLRKVGFRLKNPNKMTTTWSYVQPTLLNFPIQFTRVRMVKGQGLAMIFQETLE